MDSARATRNDLDPMDPLHSVLLDLAR